MTTVSKIITVERNVLHRTLIDAGEFRRRMARRGTFVVQLISSPGAGKTSLLEATARYWQGKMSMGVLVGDIATTRDAERLAPFMPVVQLTTGGACHLELPQIERGFAQIDELELDYLFVEDVGNLVCPASFDLGHHRRVIVLSTTEGDDKPAKYPKAFRTSQALVINKVDLLPYVPFSVASAHADALAIQPALEVLSLSALTGEGLGDWCEFLLRERRHMLAREP